MSYSDLAGKVAIVTGAGQGIGRASALAFAREGVSVAVVDRDARSGERTVAEIANLEPTGGRAIFIQADVSRSTDAARIAIETLEAFGRIDILHNNAGIPGGGTVLTTDEETWDRVIAVNLKSVFLVSKYVIPHMIAAGGGAIINTSSVQAVAACTDSAVYDASKGGVLALTRAMALDFAPHHIRVNAVLPGSIDTPTLRAVANEQPQPEAAMAEWGKAHPLGRLGTPEDVANVVVFLASNAAAFITGAPYLIDGGLIAKAL